MAVLHRFYCIALTQTDRCNTHLPIIEGMQWLSGRVLDSSPRGPRFEPHRRHCIVSLSKNINPSLVLVQPRMTRPFITERLLMGRKESDQTKLTYNCSVQNCHDLFFQFLGKLNIYHQSILEKFQTIKKNQIFLCQLHCYIN